MTQEQDVKVLDVEIKCAARSTGKMRNDMEVVGLWNPDKPWTLATDEGAFHGGDATAPPPLALFAASVTACFMTQVRAFAKKLRIGVTSVRVNSTFRWKATTRGTEPYVGSPVGFGLDIEVESEAPTEDIKRLLATAQKGCFIEQTLLRKNAIEHRLKVGDEWVRLP